MKPSEADVLKDLMSIPGVGRRMAQDLHDLGLNRVEDLRGRNPETMYQDLMDLRGAPVDRCVLYVFRCAVYYASTQRHDPKKLKWWNWKDSS
jgi:hypothetical protein